MLKNRTTFIVGAGASAEFGLPVGDALSAKLRALLSMRFDGYSQIGGDSTIYKAMDIEGGERIAEYSKACWRIANGLSLHNSIDNLIDNHRDNECVAFCGKLAIAKAILQAEKESSLATINTARTDDLPEQLERLSQTWVYRLFRIMQEGVPEPEAERFFENSSFVVFNYDRCIELFFTKALMVAYGMPLDRAASIVERADIVHVFGSLGPIQTSSSGREVLFGSDRYKIREVAAGIRTYSEQLHEGAVAGIKKRLATADCLAFLGFGFLPTNMALLRTSMSDSNFKSVVGSAWKMSRFDADAIASDLHKWSGYPNVAVRLDNDATCGDLLADYSRAFR